MSTTLRGHPPKSAWSPVKYSLTSLGSASAQQGQIVPGGLDLTTPSLRLHPGALRDALNFEVAPFGGYSRVEGYERFDGRPSPSAAQYTIVQIWVSPGVFTTAFVLDESNLDGPDVLNGGVQLDPGGFTNVTAVGQVVVQAVSGARGTVIAVVMEPIPYLALTMVTGVFDNVNALSIEVTP